MAERKANRKHLMRSIGFTIPIIAIGACTSVDGSAMVEILSQPSGALVTIDGVGECETPCSVLIDVPRYATVAKAGYLPETVQLTPGNRNYNIPLELAAASDEVDAVTLGDIDG